MKKTLRPVLTAAAAFIMLCALVIGTLASGAQNVSDDPADSYVKQTAANEDSSISLWFEHSFKKVLTSDTTPSGMDTYSVYMAKNEIENAQFVLYSDTDKTGMKAEVTAFSAMDGSGAAIPSELYYEMYVSTEGIDPTAYLGYDPENPVIRAGETPDPVAPMKRVKTFKLNGGKSQAFFIKLRSAADTPAGWYSAQLDIKNSAGEVVKTATVYAHVWDFALSEKTALQTAFYIANDTSYGGKYKTFYDYLLENRMCGMDLPGKLDVSNEYLYNDRVTAVRVSTNGCGAASSPYYIESDYSGYASLYDQLQSSDRWDEIKNKFYFYNVDEPKVGEMESVIDSANKVRSIWPGAATVVPVYRNLPYPYGHYTTNEYSESSIIGNYPMYERVDLMQAMIDNDSSTLLCPMTFAFTPHDEVMSAMPHYGDAAYSAENSRGYVLLNDASCGQYIYTGGGTPENIIKYYDWDAQYGEMKDRMASAVALDTDGSHRQWAYCCMRQNSYNYAQQLIENTGLQTKMLFWQLYQEDVTGYLYYATNGWSVFDSRNDNYIDRTVTGDKTNVSWKTNKVYYGTGYIYGDGVMFYGASQGNIFGTSYIGSLRVELMRDGIEEYQMLKMLEELKGKDTAKAVVGKVSKNVVNYLSMPAFRTTGWDSSMDEYDIMASVRRELGNAVEEAALAGQCDHKWDAGVEVKAAGCITTGEKKFTCTLCGAERTEIIPTLHSVGNTFSVVSGSPATCTSDSTQVLRCSVCGYEKTEYAKAFHTDESHWKYDSKSSTLHTVKCDTCGMQLEVGSHTMLTQYTNTCTEDGEKQSVCRYCGYTEVIEAAAAKGHNYVNGVCTRCGAKEAGATHTLTIGGTATEYAAGETVNISAETFYTANHLYYRFTGWSGDTDVLSDATQAEASFTMPEKDIVLEKEYLIIGDFNGDGDVNAIDLNLMRRALIGLYNKTASMDVNKDDELNAIDLNLFRRMLIGLYAPTK